MKALCDVAPLLGRILLAPLFLLSGYGKITGFMKTAQGIAAKNLPFPEVLTALSIAVEIGGILMILIGWRARLGALLILLWMIPVTLVYHAFWADPSQLIAFLKNLAIMGALLFVIGFGPGKYSVNDK